MIPVTCFKDRTVAVLGLGRSGLAAVRALAEGNARVLAWDDDPGARERAAAAGIAVSDAAGWDWMAAGALVLSPGIPHTHPRPHPAAAAARAAGRAIIGDIELLARSQAEAVLIGITGTNGKSTTTALIGHVLAQAGRRVEVGGNLGRPALDLDPLGAGGLYVLEVSSYQLELSPSVVFDVAVLVNITPDHLDRHGGMSGYVAAKRRLFQGQGAGCWAVVAVDDEHCRAVAAELRAAGGARVVPVSAAAPVAGGVHAAEGILIDDIDGRAAPVLDLRAVAALPGRHNWQNAAAAYAAARAVGLDAGVIAAGIGSYPGLAHRQERVAVIGGVAWINDSKATNVAAVAKALDCYDAIYWIAGGRPKGDSLDALAPWFPRVRHAFLIGEAAPAFARALAGRVPATIEGDLATAVARAHAMTAGPHAEGAVVLLSPACASFDQFASFEARGDAFRAMVAALAGRDAGDGG